MHLHMVPTVCRPLLSIVLLLICTGGVVTAGQAVRRANEPCPAGQLFCTPSGHNVAWNVNETHEVTWDYTEWSAPEVPVYANLKLYANTVGNTSAISYNFRTIQNITAHGGAVNVTVRDRWYDLAGFDQDVSAMRVQLELVPLSPSGSEYSDYAQRSSVIHVYRETALRRKIKLIHILVPTLVIPFGLALIGVVFWYFVYRKKYKGTFSKLFRKAARKGPKSQKGDEGAAPFALAGAAMAGSDAASLHDDSEPHQRHTFPPPSTPTGTTFDREKRAVGGQTTATTTTSEYDSEQQESRDGIFSSIGKIFPLRPGHKRKVSDIPESPPTTRM